MRHLRPALVLVAALGLFSALAGLVAFGRRQADLIALPRSAPAFAALRPPVPPPEPASPLSTSVTLLLLTGSDPAVVAHLVSQPGPASAWADVPLRPEPWGLPVRLAMALTGAGPEAAGPDLFAPPGGPDASPLANPDNVFQAARAAGRSVACVTVEDAPPVALGKEPCARRWAGGTTLAADLLLGVARAEALTPALWAALVPVSPTHLTLLVAESAPGAVPPWGHLWLRGPGVVPRPVSEPVARADVAATGAALLGVAPPTGGRGQVLDALVSLPAPQQAAAHLALLRGRVALLDRLLAEGSPDAPNTMMLEGLRRTVPVAADDLRLGNTDGAARLLAPALVQADQLLVQADADRVRGGQLALLLPVVIGLLGLGGVLAWLVRGAPVVALGRRRLAAALGLGAGAWLAGQGIAGLAGAWLADHWLPAPVPDLPLLIGGAGAGAVLLASALAGLGFRRLASPVPPARHIPLPSVRLVQQLLTPSPRPGVLAVGAVCGLGALAAALAWGLALGWAGGGPVADWTTLPPLGFLAAHLAGLLGLAGAGLALPLAPFLAWGCYRLRSRHDG